MHFQALLDKYEGLLTGVPARKRGTAAERARWMLKKLQAYDKFDAAACRTLGWLQCMLEQSDVIPLADLQDEMPTGLDLTSIVHVVTISVPIVCEKCDGEIITFGKPIEMPLALLKEGLSIVTDTFLNNGSLNRNNVRVDIVIDDVAMIVRDDRSVGASAIAEPVEIYPTCSDEQVALLLATFANDGWVSTTEPSDAVALWVADHQHVS